ncbi:MAG TPA: PAS domain-containing protein [Spirochaetia bacterium]|nr:PAS domain-containing protein [Spirochaetia bacterium]
MPNAPLPEYAAALAAAGAALLAAGVLHRIRLGRLRESLRRRESELVELSERLRRHSEHLRLVIDTVPAYIYAKDDAGHFILVNRLFARVFGVEPEEVTGKTNEDYGATPEETARFMEEDREILRTGRPLFVPEERAAGSRPLKFRTATRIGKSPPSSGSPWTSRRTRNRRRPCAVRPGTTP